MIFFHNQRFRTKKLEGRRQALRKSEPFHQFVTIEGVLGIDCSFVVPKRLQVFIGQRNRAGDADAVFAGKSPPKRARFHDAFDNDRPSLLFGRPV